jgi:hypothetical protein
MIIASSSGTPAPANRPAARSGRGQVRDVIHAFNIEVIVTTATTRPEKLGLPFRHWSVRKLGAHLAAAGTMLVSPTGDRSAVPEQALTGRKVPIWAPIGHDQACQEQERP